MNKGQYQLLLGLLIIISIGVSVGILYYWTFKPETISNQTTTTTGTTTASTTTPTISTTTPTISATTSTTTHSTTETTTSSTSPTANQLVSMTGTVAYVIGLNGSIVYARNGDTGQIDYSGTDATIVIQNALIKTSSNGGGTVVLRVGRYYMSGVLSLPTNVALVGELKGPFDPSSNPATTTVGPTFLITSNSTEFITVTGYNTALENIIFVYPNQVSPSASTPISYPFTVKLSRGQAGFKARNLLFVNSYQAIDLEGGRALLEDLWIGAFRTGIFIDHSADVIYISNVIMSVFWDTTNLLLHGQPIDNWVQNNGYGLVIERADGVYINNMFIFYKYDGIYLRDSYDTSLSIRNSWGSAVNVVMDAVQYGLLVQSTQNGPGWTFSNLQIISAVNNPKSAVYYQTGGTQAPKVRILGGSFSGAWAAPVNTNAVPGSYLYISDIQWYNPVGAITAPSIPASGTPAMNTQPFKVQVFVNGGTVSNIAINGANTGMNSGTFLLMPTDTITLFYSSSPSWAWFGL